MTERLYYHEPDRREFDATVQQIERRDGRLIAILDRTAFYPSSGGQPFDTGMLGEARVIDVIDRDDGSIGHVVDGQLSIGERVRGTIDWGRRFDHMQQHTGQHVLSAAFERLHEARTVSFHLGSESATIDLARELSAQAIDASVAEANRICWEDRPVSIRIATADEAAALPLRKEPVRTGLLRLIEIEGYDVSACGGTHVNRTGAIGLIAVTSWERFKGGLRVEFLCGERALRSLVRLRDLVASAARLLSIGPGELPAGVERLQLETRDLRRSMKALQEQLSEYQAAALALRGARAGDRTVVVEALDGTDAAALKQLASAIAAHPAHAVALFSRSLPALAVIARSSDVALDASLALRSLTAKFGGRGGGKPELAQGGGLQGPLSEILAAAREALSSRA